MNGKEFSESDFLQAKRMAEEIYLLEQKLSDFIFNEKKLPIAIKVQVELLPWHMDEPTSLEQFKIWMKVLWMLKMEFSGEIKPAED